MNKNTSRINGKKGGRPKGDVNNFLRFPDIKLVIITETQYQKLIKKYGQLVIKKAISILDDWLKSSPVGHKYAGKNNYAHFRSDGWLINAAKNAE